MNGLTLAYIGDAYYELKIRDYVINLGYRHVNLLHNIVVKYTSGIAQSFIIEQMMANNLIDEEEIKLYKRGRNHKSSGRKNIDAKTYNQATGFEALIGHTYLNDLNRCNELILLAIEIINKGEDVK